MTKRIFVLGAGFSELAGFPLAKNFLKYILEQVKISRDSRDIEFHTQFHPFINKLKDKYPWIIADVEVLFTYIDLAILNNNLGLFSNMGYSFDFLKDLRMRLSGAIVRSFQHMHLDFLSQKPTKELQEIDEIYYKFCDHLNENDVIITFNYDNLVEKGLWLQKKWTFLDGYSIEKNINDFNEYPADKPIKSIIKVYKLHGSLGWCYNEFEDQIIFSGMKDYFTGYNGLYSEKNWALPQKDESTTFIEPSYIKHFTRPIILKIWEDAFAEFHSANELFIIGYSLPNADSTSRIHLSSSIRKFNIQSISVINPPPENWLEGSVFDKYEQLFGRNITKIPKKFKEWVKEEL